MESNNKYTINHHALSVGTHSFEWSFGDEMFENCTEESGIFGGEGKIHIDLKKGANLMEAQVEIEGVVRCECDRCMGECEQGVEYDGTVIIKSAYDKGEYDGDIIWIDPSDDALDMEQWLFESIVLSLPMQRMHSSREECDPEAMKYLSEGVVENEEDDDFEEDR